MLSSPQSALLRALSIGDEVCLHELLSGGPDRRSSIDHRVACLVRLSVVIATDATQPAYQREVQRCLDAGASADEILDVLLTVAANIGASRVISAAPKLAMALGYDVDEGLEDLTDEE
jgi:alkylhydroperoxidase/carboxymuconolactone decarboxylase family protein YurZ